MTDPTVLRGATAWIGRPGERRLVSGVDLLLDGGRVARVGSALQGAGRAQVVDARAWLVVPGFVNGHHHLSQQLTRTRAIGSSLIDWLFESYGSWIGMDADLAHAAALVGLTEALLCGVTTVSDFTYLYPRGHADMFGAQVAAAKEVGVRFAPVRGGMVELEAAVAERLGDRLQPYMEDVDGLLQAALDAVRRHHDRGPDSMCRVGIGLTEKAYGAPQLMTEMADLAERLDVRLHTHFHPRPDERALANRLGTDPVQFLRDSGWWNERLWVAHGTGLLDGELVAMARDRVGLCTCPSSNARFATPLAPAADLHRRGGAVGIGVDGAASNDSGDFLGECRLAWQAARIRDGAHGRGHASPSPVDVLDWATAGGARLLDWPEIGWLGEGALADLAAFRLDALDRVAAEPLAGLLMCGISHRADAVFVGGRQLVRDGRLVRGDETALAKLGRRAAERLEARVTAIGHTSSNRTPIGRSQ